MRVIVGGAIHLPWDANDRRAADSNWLFESAQIPFCCGRKFVDWSHVANLKSTKLGELVVPVQDPQMRQPGHMSRR